VRKGLSGMGYGSMSAEKWLLSFGEAIRCIFRLGIVEVFVDGGSEPTKHGNYYQTAWHEVPGNLNLILIS
jgi:hypothetical protein